MASTYRGKYPSRIRAVGGLTGQPGKMLVETNDGRKFTVHVRTMRAAGVSESLLKRGTELSALVVYMPFDAAEARAIAALHLARKGSPAHPIRPELAAAIRCPAAHTYDICSIVPTIGGGQMSMSQGWAEGRKWASMHPNATDAERAERVEKFRAAWGDNAAHGFWNGSREHLSW